MSQLSKWKLGFAQLPLAIYQRVFLDCENPMGFSLCIYGKRRCLSKKCSERDKGSIHKLVDQGLNFKF